MKKLFPEGLKGKDLFIYLVANKKSLMSQKKATIKHADPVCTVTWFVNDKGQVVKENNPVAGNPNQIKVASVINTTMYLDSHDDVHIDGLWKKSLGQNRQLYLLQEHSMTFKGIITDEIKSFTKKMPWRELGLDIDGISEALIFNSTIYADRNEFMFDQYKSGRVKNHSVGMQYVDLTLAINDEDYKEEFAEWNKYIDRIANKDDADEQGFFFPIIEAKCIEGSAVPIGSNPITPTLDNNMKSLPDDTENRPSHDTGNRPFDMSKAIKETTFLKF